MSDQKISGIITKSGFSLVEVMIGLGIMSVVILGSMSMLQILTKQQKQSNITFQADTFRRTLVQALNNASAWPVTAASAANPSLDCYKNSKPCTTNETDLPGGVKIQNALINKVFDSSGGIVLDASSPNFGLSPQGTPCPTFVDPTVGPGDDRCPLRFEVTWNAICTATTCMNAQPQFMITPKFNPSSTAQRISFNPANYGAVFLQGQNPGTGVCWTLAGTSLYETCADLGIGLNAPLAKTHIKESVESPFGGLMISNILGTPTTGANTSIYVGADNNTHIGGVYTSPDAIVINNGNGNVGINTTTPFRRLTVSEPTGTAVLRVESAAGPNAADVELARIGSAVTWTMSQYTDDTLRFIKTGGTNYTPLVMTLNGNVGIGTTMPRTALEVAGQISGPMPGTNGATSPLCYNGLSGVLDGCSSLKKYKRDIVPLDIGLAEILKLEPVSYVLKATGEREIGFIAEDAVAVDERFGQKATTGKLSGVKYGNLTAPLTKAVQELYGQMRSLEDENADLKNQLATMSGYLCAKDASASFCAH